MDQNNFNKNINKEMDLKKFTWDYAENSITDMKVIAIIQRGSKKDFIDLWAIIKEKQYSLKDIFFFCQQKYDTIFSESVALKALVYFQDAEEERIELGMKSNFSWDIVKNDLTTISREYLNKYLQKS